MNATYAVEIETEMAPGYITIPCTSKNDAISTAKAEAQNTTRPVFVGFHRSSDDQTGYLNPDGSFDITGQRWN